MKNKSKLKKMKQKKQLQKPVQPNVVTEWLYLNQKEISFEALKTVFEKDDTISVQIWKEAGVAEIEIAEAKSIDLELAELDLGDEAGNAFLKEKEAETLWLVTISAQSYDRSIAVMEQVVEAIGGFFCGDTEDFTPVVSSVE